MKIDMPSIQLETIVEQIIAAQRGQAIKKDTIPMQLTPGKLLRINQFIPDIYPICKSKWWDGVKKGIYPAPIKLGPRTTAWRSDDLIALIEKGV